MVIPTAPGSCQLRRALVACRQDHLVVVDQLCGSQVDGIKTPEASLLGQPTSISNESLGDLDHVKLIVQTFEVIDRLSQPALVDSVETAGHC